MGQKLKELRKKKRYTTREVGEFIGISNAYVSKIE
ncbi:helix-turn-helix domain-containing protein, partial [Ornithinibacillus scapharcae]